MDYVSYFIKNIRKKMKLKSYFEEKDIKEMRNSFKCMEEKINECQWNINDILDKFLGDGEGQFHNVGEWDCADSPLGRCIYNCCDSGRNCCIYCGETSERG